MAAVVRQEVPCRDTDPLPGDDEELDSNRDSPVAFTINFGFGEDIESAKEKAKKLERFALRSSLRKPKSPRHSPSEKSSGTSNENSEKSAIEITRKTSAGSGFKRATAGGGREGLKTAAVREKNGGRRENSFVREKSNLSYKSSRTVTTKSNTTKETTSVINREKSPTIPPKRTPGEKGKGVRRLTTTLSPEESKMFAHFEKEIETHSLEIVEASYDDEEFEIDDEEEEEDENQHTGALGEEREPSETGTYTVGNDDNSKKKTDKARVELESLVGAAEGGGGGRSSNYVEDWALRHHRPTSIPSPVSPSSGGAGGLSSPRGAGLYSSKSSLSKSRRRLPATPGAGPVSPDNLNFSPEDSQTPSPQQDSEEGECSFMKHTQHLVDVMEARIQKSVVNRTPSSTSLSATKKPLSLQTSGETGLDAKQAWERRKNYDPLAASGKKKDISRKNSASSIGKSGQDELNRGHSAKSGSSDSSGYFSRGDGGRFSMRGHQPLIKGGAPRNSVRSAVKPQSKLINAHSAADIKQNSSRSSSSLTSKEAEFQAWKRRKNYDPLKAVAKTSQRKSSSPKSAYSPSPTPQMQSIPQHRRLQDMTQSLVTESSDESGAPMQRSASFHLENIRARAMTSEDDSCDDYGSGGESSFQNGRYYLDEDELILPIYPASSHRSVYKQAEPKMSPSRSRSGSRLEALDNLVISTIYSVSSKLCANTSNIIRRANQTFPPADEDQATTLETVLYLLEDVDLPSSPAKKTSRELSGTLRNLKKVEQAMEMLNKLMENEDQSID